jgi:hypothetical protein
VKYYQNQIKKGNETQPIWLVVKDRKYILLDGAHRVVAYYIEKQPSIDAYIIIL